MRGIVYSLTCLWVFVVAGCDSPYKRLTVVDTGIRGDKARRDMILETDRRAEALGLATVRGRWQTGDKTASISYRRAPGPSRDSKTLGLPIVDASYSETYGLILRFAYPVECVAATPNACTAQPPVEPFNVRDELGRNLPGSECFTQEPGKGNEIADEGRTLIFKVKLKDDCKGRALSIVPNADRIKPKGARVAGEIPLWVEPSGGQKGKARGE